MRQLVYIVAKNYSHARMSARDLGLSPMPGLTWWHVKDEHCLRGLPRVKVHYGSDWDEHPRILAIQSNLERIGDVEVV